MRILHITFVHLFVSLCLALLFFLLSYLVSSSSSAHFKAISSQNTRGKRSSQEKPRKHTKNKTKKTILQKQARQGLLKGHLGSCDMCELWDP